ncbi:MAG: hypothetical protein KDG52_20205 [Rhodocyclaceae bacterium]|nr:hypothetical protein [Rhodocyclaceae bacterium]
MLAAAVLCVGQLPAASHAGSGAPLAEFLDAAQGFATTPAAVDALREGPGAEFYRWGDQACEWVRLGRADFDATTANYAEFWGEDLARAPVLAARQVICPELARPAESDL